MALAELIMPKMGESITEATILKWMKQVGDPVKLDETILEIATDKVDSEVPSNATGILKEILHHVNEVVPVGAVLARIEVGTLNNFNQLDQPKNNAQQQFDEHTPSLNTPQISIEKELISSTNAANFKVEENPEQYVPYVPSLAQNKSISNNNRFFSPLVLNIANSEGLSLSELEAIPGTGADGRVSKKDILQYIADKKSGKVSSFIHQSKPVYIPSSSIVEPILSVPELSTPKEDITLGEKKDVTQTILENIHPLAEKESTIEFEPLPKEISIEQSTIIPNESASPFEIHEPLSTTTYHESKILDNNDSKESNEHENYIQLEEIHVPFTHQITAHKEEISSNNPITFNSEIITNSENVFDEEHIKLEEVPTTLVPPVEQTIHHPITISEVHTIIELSHYETSPIINLDNPITIIHEETPILEEVTLKKQSITEVIPISPIEFKEVTNTSKVDDSKEITEKVEPKIETIIEEKVIVEPTIFSEVTNIIESKPEINYDPTPLPLYEAPISIVDISTLTPPIAIAEEFAHPILNEEFTTSETYIQNTTVEQQPTVKTIEATEVTAAKPSLEILEMDRMRKLISKHMTDSVHTSAHVTSFTEADVTNMVQWRDKVKNDFEKREGLKITFTPMFIECILKVLKRYPLINSSVEGDKIIIKNFYNIGVATSLPTGNLIVPVIKHAENHNLVSITRAVNTLADNARNNKLKPEDVTEGTFTFTNVGNFGTLMGTPIINQPQVAILAAGTIKKKPVVIETEQGDFIGIRHIVYLSLSYDHRIIDGSVGASFLTDVAKEFESWDVNRELKYVVKEWYVE